MKLSLRPALSIFLLAYVATLLLGSCAQGPTRQQARAATVVTAHAVQTATDVCAMHAQAISDLDLARQCRDAYDATRLLLLTTAKEVDRWDAAITHSRVTCAVVRSLQAFDPIVERLEQSGRTLPTWHDAHDLVLVLGSCREKQP